LSDNKPLVTIGVAVYNGANYIIKTLESINNQTYSNIEIVIVDDGSSDNSYNLCVEWIGKCRFPVSLSKNISNLGLPKTRNVILNKMNGKYLNLFDQDDIMLPRKIEDDVALSEIQTSKTALIYSKVKLIDEKGELLDQEYFDRIKFKLHPVKDMFIELIRLNFISAPTVMVRADIIKEKGYDESLQFDDWDMWLRLSKEYEFYFADYSNVYYRIHNNSMMANKNYKQTIIRNNANIRMFEKHLGINKRYNEAIYRKLKELSIYSYFLEDLNSGKVLQAFLKRKFDIKVWLYHRMASLGIKHHSHWLK
jgi:glycosyltransferase involved in cell wall biosynthesis